jgi:hypothetical protein
MSPPPDNTTSPTTSFEPGSEGDIEGDVAQLVRELQDICQERGLGVSNLCGKFNDPSVTFTAARALTGGPVAATRSAARSLRHAIDQLQS